MERNTQMTTQKEHGMTDYAWIQGYIEGAAEAVLQYEQDNTEEKE